MSDFLSPNAVQSPVQDSDCAVYILHAFPSDVFLDSYELNQRVQDRITPSFMGIWGETDLELPVAAVGLDRGSSILFGPLALAPASSATAVPPDPKSDATEIDFPFHARYPRPRNITAPYSYNGRTHEAIHIPVPALLHVCERVAHEDRQAQSVQQTAEILNTLTALAPSFIPPFNTSKSTIHVSYPFQALAAREKEATMSTAPSHPNAVTIRVPMGALDHLAFVQPITLLAMSLCAVYVAYTAVLVATSRGASSSTRSLQGHEKRKVQ